MRKAASFLIPVTLITLYYAIFAGVLLLLLINFPTLRDFFPIGGIGDLAGRDTDSFEPVYSSIEETVLAPYGPVRLAIASLGAAILIVPVSWIYFITSRTKKVDQSFVQTIIIMPIVVAGISMIVQDSLALAFGLAALVVAVRFRVALAEAIDGIYIFAAICIGLAAGIGYLGVAAVMAMFFCLVNAVLWHMDYGRNPVDDARRAAKQAKLNQNIA